MTAQRVSNGSEFLAAVNNFSDSVVPNSVSNLQIAVTKALWDNLTYLAPIWTGRFVGSLRLAYGDVDPSFLPPHPHEHLINWPEKPSNPYHADTAEDAINALGDFAAFGILWASDAVPYAMELEAGRSQQAPFGVFNVAYQLTLSSVATIATQVQFSDN